MSDEREKLRARARGDAEAAQIAAAELAEAEARVLRTDLALRNKPSNEHIRAWDYANAQRRGAADTHARAAAAAQVSADALAEADRTAGLNTLLREAGREAFHAASRADLVLLARCVADLHGVAERAIARVVAQNEAASAGAVLATKLGEYFPHGPVRLGEFGSLAQQVTALVRERLAARVTGRVANHQLAELLGEMTVPARRQYRADGARSQTDEAVEAIVTAAGVAAPACDAGAEGSATP